MTQLAIGASLSLSVDPRPFFVPTGVDVAPSDRYRFVATGKWKDWYRNVDATGRKLWPLHLSNRVPGATFFCLCGCGGEDDRNAFAIDASFDWTISDSVAACPDRQLNLFANDWRCIYFNNHELPAADAGPLQVEIVRVA